MRLNNPPVIVSALCLIACALSLAQSPAQRNPDVSNKALITRSTPGINADAFNKKKKKKHKKKTHTTNPNTTPQRTPTTHPAGGRNENYPVRSSEAGLHTWD